MTLPLPTSRPASMRAQRVGLQPGVVEVGQGELGLGRRRTRQREPEGQPGDQASEQGEQQPPLETDQRCPGNAGSQPAGHDPTLRNLR